MPRVNQPRLATLVKRYVDEVGLCFVLGGKVAIEVTVLDVRNSYGRTEFLVEPVHGQGEAWVKHDRVHF
jgi:hypothetical protein